MNDIHTCNYYCERPACINAQRCEMRDAMFDQQTVAPQRTYEQGLEDAAKVCEDVWTCEFSDPGRDCAAAIRAKCGSRKDGESLTQNTNSKGKNNGI
jgi:hypothetical protein